MKYLIAGLGNVGAEYAHTRHNIGFAIADAFAEKYGNAPEWTNERHAWHTEVRYRGRTFHLIKPTTLVNRSGKAVRYWLQFLDLSPERLLVLVDDISLSHGKIRMRPKGSDGGHNGLKDIQEKLATTKYPRLRFGIGSEFPQGQQSQYVLGKWTTQEAELLDPAVKRAAEAVLAFGTIGLNHAMTEFNA